MNGTVIVGYDASPWSDRALEAAAAEAAARDGKLVIVHAFHWQLTEPATVPFTSDLGVTIKTNTASRAWPIAMLLASGFIAGAAIGFTTGLFEPRRRVVGTPDDPTRTSAPLEAAGARMPPARNRSVQPAARGALDRSRVAVSGVDRSS